MIRKMHLMLAAALVVVASVGTAHAQLAGSCTVVIHNQGKITLNPSGTQLSSKNGGGSSVRATVTASNGALCSLVQPLLCYGVSAPPPLLFASSPLDGSVGTVFSSTYRVDSGAEMTGVSKTQLQNGSHNVEINMAASKAVGAFGAGEYRGEVIVRCE